MPIDRAPDALRTRDVLIIQPSGIRYRARVLKIARTLLNSGRSVTFFTKMPPGTGLTEVHVDYAEGCPILLFPDAHDFIAAARTKVPAWNWAFMVQYLQTAMWHYARQLRPRYIHTFNSAAIGIGHNFRNRLSLESTAPAWFHDFPEYTAGHRFTDDRRRDGGSDDEWQQTVIGHEAKYARFPDACFTVSDEIASLLQSEYGLEAPPIVLLNVPRLSDFNPAHTPTIRRTLCLASETPLFVYSGGVTPLRGVHTLVSALEGVPEAHVALMTSTRSPYLASLIDDARQHGAFRRLHVLPYVEPEFISSFLRDSTAGIHPLTHYSNAEVALPNKLFDYLHAQVPVIVSDVRAMAHLVSQRGFGAVFKADDSNDLARALKQVIRDRARIAKRIGDNEKFLRTYSWEAQEQRLLSVYDAADRRIAQPIQRGAEGATSSK
ncbi:MAG TPA: glycosyltransferase family 4 protein [Lacipirellulaceae bacterium]|nr:glycosyltransferase family 4 protein [Lacipirellulaceae bacterium]